MLLRKKRQNENEFFNEELKDECLYTSTKSKLDEFIEYKYNNSNNNFEYKEEIISNSEIKNSSFKKYNLNILYYDENLLDKAENSDNCSFFELSTNGTFYGCHYFELFKIVCQKLIKSKKEFILLCSGSSANKIFNYCSNIKEIREYYIYCFHNEKYKPLINEYSKLKGVYNVFNHLKEKLYTIKEMNIRNISSSNLIFFDDYSKLYIKLHYEFIKKYSLYKLLKSQNCNESQFLAWIKLKYPYFLELAKKLFPNKKETIEYFKNNTNESYETIEEVFKCDDNLLDDNIKSYIHNYTTEGFYYKYLNKFLREGNFYAFRTLSSHIAKFIFKIYDYREKNFLIQNDSNLYRKIYLNKEDIKLYEQSINKVICYPSFTSTSIGKDSFTPAPNHNNNLNLVLIVIKQNNTKSCVSISEFSKYPREEEYLFLPFSFFKIMKVELNEGNADHPHIIHLLAINSKKPIEEMFSEFMENETDSLNPEGLDLIYLNYNGTEILFNKIYLSKYKH